MSSLPQNSANDHLNAYMQAIECYKQMQMVFGMPQHFMNNSERLCLLQTCFLKIQALIEIEHELNGVYEDDFCSDICTSLFCLREQIVHLTNVLQKSLIQPTVGSAVPPAAIAQPVPRTGTVLQNQINEENRMKEVVRNTQIIPRVKSLADIAGLSNVKKILIAIVILPMKQPQLYVGRKICNSVLLYGPPGTGKTLLAHALAAESAARMFSISSSDILSQYVGQTEKMVRALFQTVKETRKGCTILFMDEIDGLCKQRNDTENEWSRRLKTELMCQLSNFEDCSKVFLICATNCPWDLDPAFIRRFQRRIYVPLPRRPERFELLQQLTKGTPLEITSNYWGPLLNKTEGYSGSDLADLVRHAVNVPLIELVGTNVWEPVGNMYKPAVISTQNFLNKTFRELSEMPMYSVQARPVNISDLMVAVDVVKPTVPSASLQKYEQFMNKV